MIAFLKANTAYRPKQTLQKCSADIRIVVGGRESKTMLQSAKLLDKMLQNSTLDIKEGFCHGEYSIRHPEQYAAEWKARFQRS